MRAPPTHTPYDGSSKPFTIGLKPLDLKDWIEIDRHFEAYLAEKERLHAVIPNLVFVEEPDTREAQREVLDLLATHLTQRGADRYRRSGDMVEIAGIPRQVAIGANDVPPLRAASMLVQEDLILMRKGADGWRLVAGSLCFPSSWSLAENFGKPLHEIHDPVPAFGPGTRMAELINRMFDNLPAGQPVQRWNWSLQPNADLYHPLSNQQRSERAEKRPSKFAGDAAFATAFIRVERQTLRKLPKSGDILFTIRIHLDPLTVLRKHPDRSRLASSFASQLSALDTAQLDYKGLTADRDRLVEELNRLAGEDDPGRRSSVPAQDRLG
jgi:dimethylamine monooxygenase subunit A